MMLSPMLQAIDLGERVPSVLPPICFYCKHYRAMEQELWKNKCMAYPRGIPTEFWDEDEKHLEPRGDDKGIAFEVDEQFKDYEIVDFLKEI